MKRLFLLAVIFVFISSGWAQAQKEKMDPEKESDTNEDGYGINIHIDEERMEQLLEEIEIKIYKNLEKIDVRQVEERLADRVSEIPDDIIMDLEIDLQEIGEDIEDEMKRVGEILEETIRDHVRSVRVRMHGYRPEKDQGKAE